LVWNAGINWFALPGFLWLYYWRGGNIMLSLPLFPMKEIKVFALFEC
jgi:hypothetical protein